MRYLEERGMGFDTGAGVVPIVPAAILFDLGIGDPKARPGPEEGYAACLEASEGAPDEGSVGAGTGATVGKALGLERAIKGGVGCASSIVAGGLVVGALAAVNSWGNVVDPADGKTLAGPRRDEGGFFDTTELVVSGSAGPPLFAQSTTLAVVATNASLTKEQANKVAQMAHDGIAMAVSPAHTMFDGDIVFVLSTGRGGPYQDTTAVGSVAAVVLGRAVVRGVTWAEGLAGVPSAAEVLSDESD
ncbi:MAG: P1 family peptidase, partial [Dehalococcoidia bacterium]